MPGVRRPSNHVEAERRGRELRARFGADVQEMRERRSWSRMELAARAGLGRMVESRIERGVANPDLDALQRIAMALGRPLVVSFGGRDPLAETRDAGHLAMQELVLRLGRLSGLTGSFELPTRPSEPWRSIDVCLADPRRSRRIVVECWNTIGDIGAAVRSSTGKRAELQSLAVAGGDDGAVTGLVWVVRATSRNRALVARYPEVFARAFPETSSGWVATLTKGRKPPEESGFVWCDVGATRLFAWRRRVG